MQYPNETTPTVFHTTGDLESPIGFALQELFAFNQLAGAVVAMTIYDSDIIDAASLQFREYPRQVRRIVEHWNNDTHVCQVVCFG